MYLNNFNFKKFFKYSFIFICFILLCNSCNAKAYNVNNKNMILNTQGHDISDIFYHGNGDDLAEFYQTNYNSNVASNYVNDIKNYILSKTGYNSFVDFSNNNYYIISYELQGNTTNKSIVARFYYQSRDLGQFNLNVGAVTRDTFSSSVESIFFINPDSSTALSNGNSFNLVNLNSYNFVANNTNTMVVRSFCKNSNSYECKTTYINSTTMSFDLWRYFATYNHLLYFDSNFAFSFNFNYNSGDSSLDTYPFYNSMFLNDSDEALFFGETIYKLDFLVPPNIQNLGNNSFGFNSNYLLIKYNYNSQTSVICPDIKNFVNGICYLNNYDIPNYDPNDLSYHHYVRFFLGNDTNIPLLSNKYYIFTFRIYTPYNLSISQLRVSSGNTNNPTTINTIKVNDFTTYKDYQVIFQPNITGDYAVNFIDIYFNDFTTLTNSLSENYSFGVSSTFKYSQFNSLPSDTDITNNYNNNPLDTISSNDSSSFFSNFKINDRGLSQIILLPLNFVRSWTSATCTPLSLPLPHMNNNAILPCLSQTFNDNLGGFWSLYKIIINGVIIYRVCVSLLHIIKNLYDAEYNQIEVIDL